MLSDERRASLRHPIRAALRPSARRSRPTSSPPCLPIPRWGWTPPPALVRYPEAKRPRDLRTRRAAFFRPGVEL